ncbi:hypothetical protein EYW49_17930 [Siculibacillus lacustris]|uniref:Uncharacterized protein n=1 Tax=Siculibacillus lacustris TaxID=1549641 RepID=A0A4Q9VHL3_9HYPH|nr:hypothetical protein [Siculibacillus lacustris]TBW34626.1 hypothetical protein EYW49_17930 [Siculibacillus lacustris]
MPVFPDPRRPPPRPLVPRSLFGRLWRFFLPGAIALIAAAILTGVVDTTARPAWLFAGGVVIAMIGVVSLLRHLWDQGRAERAARDERSMRREETRR